MSDPQPQQQGAVTFDPASFQPINSSASPSNVTFDTSTFQPLDNAAPKGDGPDIAPLSKTTNPKLLAASSGENMPEYVGATGAAAAGAMAGVGGLEALNAALPSVLPHTIAGAKAIGTWAANNPMQAYVLYQLIKEYVPGAKKAIGIVKGSPTD